MIFFPVTKKWCNSETENHTDKESVKNVSYSNKTEASVILILPSNETEETSKLNSPSIQEEATLVLHSHTDENDENG